MKAEERTITKILTDQIQYEIPPYQRPYSWERENVQQLLDDVWEAYEAKDSEYFIGSVITIERERDRKYEVVDGQQRLTTLNLIFARLRDHIIDGAAKAELANRIRPQDALTGGAQAPRLLLRKKDRTFFEKHVLDAQPVVANVEKLDAPRRHLAENLTVIDAFCSGKNQQVLKLFAHYLLNNVYVVFVTTNSWQSAYRLFNVLNARGIPLSNADLIKNTLFSLLGVQANQENELKLEERWLELEAELGIETLDAFFGHYRASVTATKARGNLHEEVEPLIRKTQGGPFAFMDQVIASAESYMRIVDDDFTDGVTLRALRSLHRVQYDEWLSALLAYMSRPIPGLPEPEFVTLLEKITIQNWVRRLGRTARLTVYYQLISAINDSRNATAQSIRQIFRDSARNAEFLDLLGGELYGKPFDAAILLRLDEADQDESVIPIFTGHMTIEHVLPQALKDEYWRTRFTEDEHRNWLHRLGNLALLPGHKNSKAQYYDFDRKKKIYSDRGKIVSFNRTKEICQEPEWTVDAIQARHKRLIELARKTWTIE